MAQRQLGGTLTARTGSECQLYVNAGVGNYRDRQRGGCQLEFIRLRPIYRDGVDHEVGIARVGDGYNLAAAGSVHQLSSEGHRGRRDTDRGRGICWIRRGLTTSASQE